MAEAEAEGRPDLQTVLKILHILEETYPEVHCELKHENPFQLLVATMLSAQSTDKKVNKVTRRLFSLYPALQDFLGLSREVLISHIREIGIYQNKATNILAVCRELKHRFGGEVPGTLEELVSLPGVGRKTANVVLSNAFDVPALAVDTHVFRVSNRIGLADSKDVFKTEMQLTEAIPREQWSRAHHWLIWHGRRVCHARKPACSMCPLTDFCRYFSSHPR